MKPFAIEFRILLFMVEEKELKKQTEKAELYAVATSAVFFVLIGAAVYRVVSEMVGVDWAILAVLVAAFAPAVIILLKINKIR